jgi:uncharacterized protein YukJ
MPIQKYCVSKARFVDKKLFVPTKPGFFPHLWGKLDADGEQMVAVINIESNDPGGTGKTDSQVLYFVGKFVPDNADQLRALPLGITMLDSKPGGVALDYELSPVLSPLQSQMILLPFDANRQVGQNALHDQMSLALNQAIGAGETVYVFGQFFRDGRRKNALWGFKPDQGVHDVHRNAGSPGHHSRSNGHWQDGGIIIEHADGSFTVIMIAFQSQAKHTDADGNPVDDSAAGGDAGAHEEGRDVADHEDGRNGDRRHGHGDQHEDAGSHRRRRGRKHH